MRIAPHPSLTIQHVCSLRYRYSLHQVERDSLSSLSTSPPLVPLTLRGAYDHMTYYLYWQLLASCAMAQVGRALLPEYVQPMDETKLGVF